MRFSLAIHEAGHAVAAYHLGLTVYEIVMNRNPAYVLYEPGSTESNLLFTMAGPWAELKYDPESIYYHDIGEKDQLDINESLWDRVWKENIHHAIIARSDCYFETSIERFINIPEVWAQITALAEFLMSVDRLDGKEVTQILEAQT